MKVIIAGSRSIVLSLSDVDNIVKESGFEVTEVICGMANGVDLAGLLWGKSNNLVCVEMPADWERIGRGAGIVRNAEMGEMADALIAVWDGKSKGTSHMIDYIEKLGKPVFLRGRPPLYKF